MLGYFLMFLFVISNSLADSVSKILYINHSDLGIFEMLFMRGLIVIIFMIFLIRNNFRHILWDSIPKNMILPLCIRVNSGLLAFFCMNYAIKYLPIILVSLFANTLPLFCSLLGFLILGERITKAEVGCLILAFYGIFVLIYHGRRSSESDKTTDQQ